MAKAKQKELTWDKTSYVITCGANDVNGVRKPAVFRLGADQRIARLKAEALRMEWQRVVVLGYTSRGLKKSQAIWPKGLAESALLRGDKLAADASDAQKVVDQFKAMGDDPREPVPSAPSSNADASSNPEGLLTLAEAVKLYGDKLKADVMSKERGQADATRQVVSLQQFLRFVADRPYDPAADRRVPKDDDKASEYFTTMFKDPSPLSARPVEQIGWDQIAAFVNNIKNRRVSGYAPLTIKGACQHVSNFFGWMEDSGKWKANCNYDRLLRVKIAKLYTAAEQKQKSKGQKTYTVDELACMYGHANEQQKLYILLACNLVAAQQTLADLLLDDLHLDGEQPYVEFIRGKTRTSANGGSGIEVRYDLWPLTARLLKARVATTPANSAGLALLTGEGFPLVRHDSGPQKKSKSDSVHQTYQKLVTACNAKEQQVRPLGFKYIRKTISTMILNLTDEFTQQQALAHSRQTVAAINYTGDVKADFIPQSRTAFTRMNDALKTIWAGLQPKFEAAAAKVEAERQAAKAERRAAYMERQKAGKAARYAASKQLAVA